MTNSLQTTSWDNSNIYKNFQDPKIQKDLASVEEAIEVINSHKNLYNQLIISLEDDTTDHLYKELELTKKLNRLWMDSFITLNTIASFASTRFSVNTTDLDAKALLDKVNMLSVNSAKAFKPIQICVLRAPEEFLSAFLDDARTKELFFKLEKDRKQNDFLLPVDEEVLLTGFSLDGLNSWGKLYTEISGAMKVEVDGKTMGLAGASNLLSGHDRIKREKAFRGINAAWEKQEISACAILNSINGWRNEDAKVRSTKKELHYLDLSCHNSHISRKTLDTLMNVSYEKRSVGHEILTIAAKEFNVDKLGPWDLLAPKPNLTEESDKITFPQSIKIIVEAFNEVSPEMGEFAQMMFDKNWIDCTPSDNRAQGAYCTGFASAREPRVFVTYDGSMKNVITMAHEIGHAYHSWVMRDIPFFETFYSMTLAETASIFAETTVRDYLIKTSSSKEVLKSIVWQDLQSAQSLMINIPARFEFEKRFVELRKTKSVTVPETKELMVASQKYWYENTLSEYDEMFWASKLHFSMSGRSFYNYPYLFGYLFSLGIYAKKDSLGKDFHARYVELLRDTGRMTAEDLVMKHFKEDISKSDFWLKSISIVEESVKKYKSLM